MTLFFDVSSANKQFTHSQTAPNRQRTAPITRSANSSTSSAHNAQRLLVNQGRLVAGDAHVAGRVISAWRGAAGVGAWGAAPRVRTGRRRVRLVPVNRSVVCRRAAVVTVGASWRAGARRVLAVVAVLTAVTLLRGGAVLRRATSVVRCAVAVMTPVLRGSASVLWRATAVVLWRATAV